MRRTTWELGAALAFAAIAVLAVSVEGSAADPALGMVTGKIDRGNVLVYLEGVPGGTVDAPTAHARITQKELAFSPDVSVVLKGTTVDFPNEDKVFHNVFSLSTPARFDLGLYKSGDSKSVQFNRTGVVDIYCNIHPQMAAKVRVLDTRYFAVTANDGSFAIPNVPPGTYPVVAWQPYGDAGHASVTVEAGRTASVTLSMPPAGSKAAHTRKDGTPYGRYQ